MLAIYTDLMSVVVTASRKKTLGKKATVHQLTTMLSTSKNVLFQGHNHLLTTDADDPSLAGSQAMIKVLGHQHRWLTGGYDLEIEYF